MNIAQSVAPLQAVASPPAILGGGIGGKKPSYMLTPAQRKAAAIKQAKDFEATFVTSMMESMYAGVKTDPMFGGGQGEDMYRSLLHQEYGKAVAASGSLHIADHILSEMLRLQDSHQ